MAEDITDDEKAEAEATAAAETATAEAEKAAAAEAEEAKKAKDAEVATGWRSMLTDDAAKKQADRFESLDAVFKSNADLRRQISDRILIPGKDGDDKDVAKFRKAMGIPASAEDYKFELPDGMEIDEGEQALLDAVKPIAFAANVPAGVLNEFILGFKELEEQIVNEHVAELEKHKDATITELKKEWGPDYEPNVTIANRAMTQLGGEDLVKFLNGSELKDGGTLANDPQILRLFAKLGRQMSEDGVMAPMAVDEAKDLDARAEELTVQGHKAMDRGDRAAANKAFAERDAIEAKLSGDEPIVGAGRSV